MSDKVPYQRMKSSRFHTDDEKRRIVQEFVESGLTAKKFAPIYDIRMETLSKWKSLIKQNKNLSKQTPRRSGPYNFEARKQAVEAYMKSGLSQKDFSKIWGVSEVSLGRWNSLFQKYGMQGLEGKIFQDTFKKYKAYRRGISEKLKAEITKTKLQNPLFGLRKVRDFLHRFEGIKVSTGTIRKTLVEENIPLIEVIKKRTRSSDKVRSFERATAMQLWQTDITSYVLARNGTRVYLTVFLDDYSRYIVAWNLQLRQTSEFVINTVLDGMQKFGKPQEILTDQGRQYFSWRGKCDFQRLLERDGIKHVVARSHHPQTVGKCERLWETIGQEFWVRVRPQELSDARERLGHYINHYNHFRPHQGINGMVPADRFFGVESEVRKVLEDSIEKNALRLALDEAPRSPVFLIGKIGDKSVSLHGEGGQLIFQSPDGIISKLGSDEFGFRKILNGEQNGRNEIETKKENKITDDTMSEFAGQNIMESSERGREENCTYERSNNVRILDEQTIEDGSSESTTSASDSCLANVSTSSEWNAGGAFETTEDIEEGYEDEFRERDSIFEEEDFGIGEYDCDAGSFDCDSERDARMSRSEFNRIYSKEGEEEWDEEDTTTSSS